jgi:hypothetical protein
LGIQKDGGFGFAPAGGGKQGKGPGSLTSDAVTGRHDRRESQPCLFTSNDCKTIALAGQACLHRMGDGSIERGKSQGVGKASFRQGPGMKDFSAFEGARHHGDPEARVIKHVEASSANRSENAAHRLYPAHGGKIRTDPLRQVACYSTVIYVPFHRQYARDPVKRPIHWIHSSTEHKDREGPTHVHSLMDRARWEQPALDFVLDFSTKEEVLGVA